MDKFKRHFIWGMGDNFSSLLLRLPIPVSRVLNHLQNTCDSTNYLVTTHAEIAKDLKIHRPDVSKYMNSLVKDGHVRKADTPKMYQVTPDYFYADTEESRQYELITHWRNKDGKDLHQST